MMRHLPGVGGAVALLVCVQAASAQAPKPVAKPDPQGAALEDFQTRLNGYIDLRAKLARELKPLSPTASASELATRQDSLAAAIRSARNTARKGDLIPTRVAELLRTIVQSDFRSRNAEARRAAFSEVTNGALPIINRMFPAQAALPTVPPLLLAKLPALPDNLQYRFMDQHLVILDGDTQIIIDYVASVLPPR